MHLDQLDEELWGGEQGVDDTVDISLDMVWRTGKVTLLAIFFE